MNNKQALNLLGIYKGHVDRQREVINQAHEIIYRAAIQAEKLSKNIDHTQWEDGELEEFIIMTLDIEDAAIPARKQKLVEATIAEMKAETEGKEACPTTQMNPSR